MTRISPCGLVLTLALAATAGPAAAQTTTDSVAKFTNTSGAVGNSSIFEVGGNVGIGITTPGVAIHVAGSNPHLAIDRYSDNGAAASLLWRKARGTSGAPAIVQSGDTTLEFSAFGYDGASFRRAAQILGSVDGTPAAASMPGRLQFLTTPAGSTAPVERMRIDSAGRVVIGAGTPAGDDTLFVGGNVSVAGAISATYQDVAEWVDSDAPLPPGTIVAIDATGTNRVTATGRAYDLAIAGAVSAQPGVMLGVPGEGRILVAQSGRVRVKVDARFGAIRPGDLLVSSPTPGHAMRSEPVALGDLSLHRPGTVLGKALEGLADGTGDILALLTLQ